MKILLLVSALLIIGCGDGDDTSINQSFAEGTDVQSAAGDPATDNSSRSDCGDGGDNCIDDEDSE